MVYLSDVLSVLRGFKRLGVAQCSLWLISTKGVKREAIDGQRRRLEAIENNRKQLETMENPPPPKGGG